MRVESNWKFTGCYKKNIIYTVKQNSSKIEFFKFW